jgi:hypothetical protein
MANPQIDLSWRELVLSPVAQQNYCAYLLRGVDPGPPPVTERTETVNKFFNQYAGGALRAWRHDRPSWTAAAKALAAFLADQLAGGLCSGEQGCNTPHDGIYIVGATTARLAALESGDPGLLRLSGRWLSGYIALYRELHGVFPGFRCARAGVDRQAEAVLEAAARGVRPGKTTPETALTALGCQALMARNDDFGGIGIGGVAQMPRLLCALRVTDGPGWQLVELDRVPGRPRIVVAPQYWTLRFTGSTDGRPPLWDKTGSDPIPAGYAANAGSRILGGVVWAGKPATVPAVGITAAAQAQRASDLAPYRLPPTAPSPPKPSLWQRLLAALRGIFR